MEIKGAPELANTGQSGSKPSKQKLSCFLKQRGYMGKEVVLICKSEVGLKRFP